MLHSTHILIGLGNAIKKSIQGSVQSNLQSSTHGSHHSCAQRSVQNNVQSNDGDILKKGDIARAYLDYLNKKYTFDDWENLSNINCEVCEKDKIILIKPITSIFGKNGIIIKKILNYFDFSYNNLNNVCIVVPDFYRPLGKYKYKKKATIHKQLGSEFYNNLNYDIINTLQNSNYLRLCLGTNTLQKSVSPVHPVQSIPSIETNFVEALTKTEKHILYKTFELADEYFNKRILHGSFITTDKIPFKQKYAAMEPQKHFKKDTSTRRYILDIYKHMHK